MILLIDNYDSFTYNLVQRLGELDQHIQLQVVRNDKITADQVAELKPTHIIISPGPCTPREAGVSNEVIQRFAPTVPIQHAGLVLSRRAEAPAALDFISIVLPSVISPRAPPAL